MKLDCEQVRSLLESFEDNQLDGVTSLAVQQHLDECAACRQRLAWNAELTASLERLADRTPGAAPAARDKILAFAGADRPAPWAFPIFSWRPATAAVLVAVLVVAGSLAWQRGQRQRAEAALMPFVVNHLASLAKPKPVDLATSDLREAETWLQARLAFAVKLPERAPAGFALRGVRPCKVGNEPVGFLLYERDGQMLTCFVRAQTRTPQRGLKRVSANGQWIVVDSCEGHQFAAWDSAGGSYVMVGDTPAEMLVAFAREAAASQ